MVKVGLLVRVVAKPGKEQTVADFLAGALELAQQETSRTAHLRGPIAAALMANAAELLSEPLRIEKVDVLAAKLHV
jgi:quinol monooxygenase YgiN